MLIQTHYHLANLIYEHIEKKYKLSLRQDMLQYGSIKPDIVWKYANMPHFYDEGYSFYLTEIEQLAKGHKYRNIKDFSIKLGVILHFTADFFCFAHNHEEFKYSLWCHLNYERKLHQAFLNQVQINEQLLVIKNPLSVVASYRKRYLETKPSLEKDVEFIYTTCLKISEILLEDILLPIVQVA